MFKAHKLNENLEVTMYGGEGQTIQQALYNASPLSDEFNRRPDLDLKVKDKGDWGHTEVYESSAGDLLLLREKF
jgi:hypothetical protein